MTFIENAIFLRISIHQKQFGDNITAKLPVEFYRLKLTFEFNATPVDSLTV